jgi:hypothetical protein
MFSTSWLRSETPEIAFTGSSPERLWTDGSIILEADEKTLRVGYRSWEWVNSHEQGWNISSLANGPLAKLPEGSALEAFLLGLLSACRLSLAKAAREKDRCRFCQRQCEDLDFDSTSGTCHRCLELYCNVVF